MIVATMLGLRTYTPPNGKPREVIDPSMIIPLHQKKPNIGALESKRLAYERYKSAFEQCGGRATSYEIAEIAGSTRSSAGKWCINYDGIHVRRVGRIPGTLTNYQLVWEWIYGDE